jgi:hypothetical protein
MAGRLAADLRLEPEEPICLAGDRLDPRLEDHRPPRLLELRDQGIHHIGAAAALRVQAIVPLDLPLHAVAREHLHQVVPGEGLQCVAEERGVPIAEETHEVPRAEGV